MPCCLIIRPSVSTMLTKHSLYWTSFIWNYCTCREQHQKMKSHLEKKIPSCSRLKYWGKFFNMSTQYVWRFITNHHTFLKTISNHVWDDGFSLTLLFPYSQFKCKIMSCFTTHFSHHVDKFYLNFLNLITHLGLGMGNVRCVAWFSRRVYWRELTSLV